MTVVYFNHLTGLGQLARRHVFMKFAAHDLIRELDGVEPTIDLRIIDERREPRMAELRAFSVKEARSIGDEIGVDWSIIPIEEFRLGLAVELEHGAHDPQTDVTSDDPLMTGKIALAHLKEFPDYYTRLTKMESEAESVG